MNDPAVFARCFRSQEGYRVLIEQQSNRAKTWPGSGRTREEAWVNAVRGMLDDVETPEPHPEPQESP